MPVLGTPGTPTRGYPTMSGPAVYRGGSGSIFAGVDLVVVANQVAGLQGSLTERTVDIVVWAKLFDGRFQFLAISCRR